MVSEMDTIVKWLPYAGIVKEKVMRKLKEVIKKCL